MCENNFFGFRNTRTETGFEIFPKSIFVRFWVNSRFAIDVWYRETELRFDESNKPHRASSTYASGGVLRFGSAVGWKRVPRTMCIGFRTDLSYLLLVYRRARRNAFTATNKRISQTLCAGQSLTFLLPAGKLFTSRCSCEKLVSREDAFLEQRIRDINPGEIKQCLGFTVVLERLLEIKSVAHLSYYTNVSSPSAGRLAENLIDTS